MTSDFYVPSNWYETFFSGPANNFWEAMVPAAATSADVVFATRHLHLEPTARILDVPCGSGRHALELARSGFRVTGLDISQDAITRAEAAARDGGVAASFLRADMLHFVIDEPVDAIVCLGNSLGYFEPDRTVAFLGRLAASLRSGGRLVLDTSVCAESVFPPGGGTALRVRGGFVRHRSPLRPDAIDSEDPGAAHVERSRARVALSPLRGDLGRARKIAGGGRVHDDRTVRRHRGRPIRPRISATASDGGPRLGHVAWSGVVRSPDHRWTALHSAGDGAACCRAGVQARARVGPDGL